MPAAGRPAPRHWPRPWTRVRPEVDLSALAGIDGIAGSLIDHLEIEAGAEAAVAAALGDAMHAIVVDGNPAARQAVERLAGGDAQALLLVRRTRADAGPGWPPARRSPTSRALPTAAPAGSKPLAGCVRSAAARAAGDARPVARRRRARDR